MKTVTLVLLAIIGFCLSFGCQRKHDKNEEFDAVIQHYSGIPRDSLKLKAARFLIKHLRGQPTLDTSSVSENQVYFDLIYDTWKHEKMRVGFRLPVQTRVIDSINITDNLPQIDPEARYVDDAELVTADFLIKNIDDAFYVWENMPWAKSVSFDNFCEYILPYRCSSTYALDARRFFLKRYEHLRDSVKGTSNGFIAANFIKDDIARWFAEDPNVTTRYPYLQPIKFSNLLKGKVGDCQDAHSLRVTAFRSLGIPAVMDELPNWGNSNLKHFWYRIIDPAHDTVTTRITNRNAPDSTQHVISSSSFDAPDFHEYPPNIELKYGRSVPKVYRRCFASQPSSLGAIKKPDEEVPEYFRNSRIRDVTNEYVVSADVEVHLENKIPKQKYAYLCVFDNQRWTPVAWAACNGSKAIFRLMGKNIVYLPAYYANETVMPAGKPFLLDDNGIAHSITVSNKTEKVVLFAKFPKRTYVLADEHTMVGARFQLANKSDFSDTVTVHTVKTTPFSKTSITVSDKKRYRYLIYQFRGIPIAHLSELQFFGLDKDGKEVELHGKLIGSRGSYPYKTERIFDGDRASYFKSAKDDQFTYVGIDLGQNNLTRITRITYIAHGDDNNVVFNDQYHLLYWNGDWISTGFSRADMSNSVSFERVPENALLLLKNNAGGIEERIFRMRAGRQEFW
jgi:hypothetical protein